MGGILSKFSKKELRKISSEGREIIQSIEDIKNQIYESKKNFDMATDSSLIDCYIYEIISLNKKYEYFLQKAKEMGLIAGGFEKIG